MPSLVGYHHVSLSVTNADASAAWYCSVLGFAPAGEPFENREWGFRRARLRHPETGTRLALTAHFDGSGDRFSERRTGMDHVAFLVPGLDDLRTWEERLEQLGVEHSAIKPMADGGGRSDHPAGPGQRADRVDRPRGLIAAASRRPDRQTSKLPPTRQ